MGIFSKLFGPKVDFDTLIEQGAVIVDVRTKGEFQSGHVKGSINIPLDQIEKGMSKLSKNKTVITCCASGMRSSVAKSRLRSAGFRAENGGSWQNLRKFGK